MIQKYKDIINAFIAKIIKDCYVVCFEPTRSINENHNDFTRFFRPISSLKALIIWSPFVSFFYSILFVLYLNWNVSKTLTATNDSNLPILSLSALTCTTQKQRRNTSLSISKEMKFHPLGSRLDLPVIGLDLALFDASPGAYLRWDSLLATDSWIIYLIAYQKSTIWPPFVTLMRITGCDFLFEVSIKNYCIVFKLKCLKNIINCTSKYAHHKL